MAALNWGADPEGLHTASCAVWTSDADCDCDPPAQHAIQRMTTAQLVDLIASHHRPDGDTP